MSRWYRAYAGTVKDDKLAEAAIVAGASRSVSIAVWHSLLESAAETADGGRFETTARRVAAILGEAPATIEAVFAAMTEIGMIEGQAIAAWKRRQFESDSSTERSRRHREVKKNAPQNECNGVATLQRRSATPPDTETDTDTSVANAPDVGPSALDGELILPIAKPKPPPSPSRGCRIPPGFPGSDEREWAKHNLGFTDDDFDECAAEFRDYWSGAPGQRGVKCDWPATFRNGARKFRPRGRSRQAYAPGNQRSDGSLLGAYQRAAARVRAQNDVPQRRPGIFDHGGGELEMQYGIPAE